MRTRTRTDSPVEQRLDLSWDTPSAETPPVVNASDDEAQKPLESSTTSSEPVSPPPSMEASASSNSADTPSQEPSKASSATSEVPAEEKEVPAEPSTQPSHEPSSPTEDPSSTEAEVSTTTEDASKETAPVEPPSPALPSQEAEQPLASADDASQEPPATTEPETPAPVPSSEPSPKDSPEKPEENPVIARPSRKPAPPVNIIPKDDPVGVVLSRKRQEANVKIEDLAKRLNISEFVIRYLEAGDYDGLSRTFGESNCIYIIFNFKSIGEELGMSKNEIDDLVEKLNKEIEAAGIKLDAPVKHDNEAREINSTTRRRPVKSVLPKLALVTLLFVCVLIILLSVVVPYVSRIRSGNATDKDVDFVPFIEQPWESMRTIPPQALPIP